MARPPAAPSAARIAISRRRVVARASCRLATFAVAASSSSPTAASSTISGRRTSAVTAACMGVAVTPTAPLFPKMAVVVIAVSGTSRPRDVPSAAAWDGVESGRTAAIALNIDSELPATGGTRNGSQARMVRSGNAAASARTPTTVCAWPSSCTARPSTPGSALKRWRHRCSDSTTTGPRAAVSSASVKGDPIKRVTPNA